MARVVIITLSNKPKWLPEAIRSVKEQTVKCLHLWAVDDGHYLALGKYPPAAYFNEQVRMHTEPDDYIAWLSDDDYLLPNFAADLGGYLDKNPWCGACYGLSNHMLIDEDGRKTFYRTLPDIAPEQYDTLNTPGGKIDGGQYLVRRSVLEQLRYPYTQEDLDRSNRVNDAMLMNRIAHLTAIRLVPVWVLENRSVPESSHTRPAKQHGVYLHDWRQP